jgi:hypothetical protein
MKKTSLVLITLLGTAGGADAACIKALDQSNYGMFCRSTSDPAITRAISLAVQSGRPIAAISLVPVKYVDHPGVTSDRYLVEIMTK